ncbi:MAG: hypothetical protein ACXAB2_10115 [Candidatus Hodarchaeales archaeon]|jgi:hypothetical protein
MADDSTDGLIGLIGSVVFAVCAIVVPFLKMTGLGFITAKETILTVTITQDIFWDGAQIDMTGIPAVSIDFADFIDSSVQIIWDIAGLWMYVFLVLGLIGFLLVALPSAQKLVGMEPMNVGFLGFLAGLVATLVHYLLIVGGAFLDEAFTGGIEDVNLIVLGLMIVAWIALFIGYKKAAS